MRIASISALRVVLQTLGERVRLLRAPAGVDGAMPSAPAAALALTGRIQARLDPQGVFDSGRFLRTT